MRTLLILTLLLLFHSANAQLIDPFGKIVTHEIKLAKLDDGTYKGAIEWTTGGIDSLQRFVVKGLSVKAPVMVRIITKAPNHNIDVSFHKSNWDMVESKIATKGDKFADKIFRTMNIAGIGVASEVAGIPYLLIVTVGLQFPSTKSLIRVTDDIEEYNRHLAKLGLATNTSLTSNTNGISNTSLPPTQNNSNTLMYIIIGLLGLIIVLLVLFLLRKRQSKNTLTLFLLLCGIGSAIAQNEPKPIPIDGQGNSPVFFEYGRANVTNQTPVTMTNPNVRVSTIEVGIGEGGVFRSERFVHIESNPESTELSPEEYAELQRRMNDNDEKFDQNYRENNPGEPTDGDQRTLPVDRTQEEIAQLRREVRQLRRQVELLSQEDEEYDEDEDNQEEEVLLYCEDIRACESCVNNGIIKFNNHLAYWNYLQHFYLSEVDELNDKIEYGNTLASMPSFGIAWGPILTTVIRPAMNDLKRAYNKKFDEYIMSIEADLRSISNCYQGSNGRFRTNNSYEIQAVAIINSLKASRINK